jgi:hypothetical protein
MGLPLHTVASTMTFRESEMDISDNHCGKLLPEIIPAQCLLPCRPGAGIQDEPERRAMRSG